MEEEQLFHHTCHFSMELAVLKEIDKAEAQTKL